MNKKIHRALATILVIVMALGVMTVGASAAEIDSGLPVFSDSTVTGSATTAEPLPLAARDTNHFWVGSPPSKWVCVADDQGGINSTVNLSIENFNAALYQMDIQLFGRNGLLFHLDNCTKLGSGYSAWCGSDVVAVWIRIQPRASLITGDRSFRVAVTY